jgi:hypothetical protein
MRSQLGFGVAIHAAPRASQSLDVGRGAMRSEPEQALFRFGCRHAGERAHLGVGHLALRKGPGDQRQLDERPGGAHLLAGGVKTETDAIV